jgi:two-component system cell cycle sensor histidine kinase/response regulator CckA
MAHNQLSRTAYNLRAATAGLTGDRFFAALAKALAENLGMRWAFVGEIKNAHISVLAGYGNGAPIDPFDYELRGSACEQVLTQDSGSYQADVAKTFPEDKLLGDLGIESYFGITVRSVTGHPIGIINAMDDKPMAEPPKCAGLLQLYTLRVGSEIERRRLKQQLIHSQKLESLGVLTGGIVHAFNNLLAGILGDIENALSATPADNHTATRPLHDATVAARAAGELTQQLLAYAEASGSNRQPIAVARHIEETVAMMRCMLASETKLHTSIPGGTPNVIADPSQLRQVLINLVVNANESIQGAAGTVTIALGTVAANSPDFDHLHHRSDNFTPNAEHVALALALVSAKLTSHRSRSPPPRQREPAMASAFPTYLGFLATTMVQSP